jgi:hypothetical protein
VQRHLAGEPVLARHATAFYRWGKWVGRSRAGLALGAFVAACGAAAVALSLAQVQRANEAAARARAARDFVLDTFRVDPAAELANADLRRAPREYLLQRGGDLIDARFQGQPLLQAELHGVVSGLYDDLARFELSERHAARREDALSRIDAPAQERAAAAMALSQALLKLGRSSKAEAPAVRAIDWAKDDRRLTILARLQLVASLAAQGKAPALSAELDRVDAQIEQLLAPGSIEQALALNGRAALAAMTGHADLAVGHARQAVAVATTIEGGGSRRVLNLRWNLWRMLSEQRRIDEARDLGASIIADLRQLGGPRDSTAAFAEIYQTSFLFAHDPAHRLSFEAAEAVIRADREIVRLRSPRGIAEAAAWSDYFLGVLYAAWHDFDRAEPLLKQAIARVAPMGDEMTLVPYARRALAWSWIVRGDHALGEEALRSQLSLMARHGSGLADRTRATLAFSQAMQGGLDEALETLGPMPQEPAGVATAADPRSLEVALVRYAVLVERGQASAALATLPGESAFAVLAGADEGRHGEALCAAGRSADGLVSLQAFLASQGARRSPASPFLARTRAVAGLCAMSLGDAKLASALARQARSALAVQPRVSPYFRQPLERLEGALATATVAGRARR